ncbi:hypothetical protein [Kordia sp.]|uniref:hypothetical protein n=1 Tax=Kordia sp. TaxID=1965332 RepID=UPI003D6AF59C
MKKRNFTPLTLNKTSISSLESSQILGGASKPCFFSVKPVCETKICSSTVFQDCTVTYAVCETEPRFCGAF